MMHLSLRMRWLLTANAAALVICVATVALKLLPDDSDPDSVGAAAGGGPTPLSVRRTPLGDIQRSPLFSPSRQPAAEVKTLPASAPMPVAELPQLVGIVSENGNFRALLSDTSTKIRRFVRQGEEFNGWTLVAISNKKVILKTGERTETIDLLLSRAAAATMPATSDIPAQ